MPADAGSDALADARQASSDVAQASDALFRLLVDSVEDYAIFVLDPAGHVATWNAGAQRSKGYTASEIIGRHFSAFYPDDGERDAKCAAELATAAATGRFHEEGWRVRKDGSRFWASVTITALRAADGALVGYGKVTRDLSERRDAEDAARAADTRFGLLIDNVRDYAIFMLHPDGRVASWNPGAQRIKGYTAREIIGRHFSAFYPDDDIRAGTCELELEVAAQVGRFEDEGWRLRQDGTRFWANVVISAVRDRTGQLVGFAKITRDLTDRVRAEEERAAHRAADETNRAKDEFLAMLGHELRNPLAPIVTAIELLKQRADVRPTRELQIIERQTGQMIRLVDDLLDVSRVSRGKVALQLARIDLRTALATAVEMALPAFEKKGQHVTVEIDRQPLWVDGDEARLVQVVANLLANANRYTPVSGHVALVVQRTEDAIAIAVRDDGAGIEPALLPRVFDLFVQGYQAIDRPEGGLGIGLTLVRALVELHQGTVAVDSPGKGAGSTFTVRLAAADPPAAELVTPAPAAPVGPRQRRVLVVDDNEDARALLNEVLTMLGHDVRDAADGPGALRVLETFTPTMAILDIGLPGMDGHALAALIRARPGGAAIRLVALSGYNQPAGATAAFDAYLVKPVQIQRVIDELALCPPIAARS